MTLAMLHRCAPVVALFALLPGANAFAQTTVSLQGMLGNRALLIVDGGAPRSAAPGSSVGGVRVISTSGNQAVVSINGQERTLRVGETPVNVGGAPITGSGDRISLSADSRGHFVTMGSINNRPVQFLVDTGASSVALGKAEADRLNLDYKSGNPVRISTANGVAEGWRMRLHSIRVGDVTVYDVEAVITPMAMPAVLLGNSFLNRFNMRRDADQMTLSRR
ncbi:retropepsin-like aspartic protease family protein [Ottowia thiooxydans]|uniref:Aspartyl protease family protein n=1 Tax=Ottowia thiooxydans TaxID=219182 RepID=A0ABV2Q6J2_9BURK